MCSMMFFRRRSQWRKPKSWAAARAVNTCTLQRHASKYDKRVWGLRKSRQGFEHPSASTRLTWQVFHTAYIEHCSHTW